MIKMNIPVIFQFLKDLSANNNRDWFNEHRAEYETARVEFENFLATVIARISLFDESIRGIQPKDCTYRIYRDTRFSTDKTPYKIHFGGYINAKGGSCEVYLSPFAVFLNENSRNYVEPDISVICDPSKLNDKGCAGAPDWIIEIVSPASRKMDYLLKLFKYHSAGVREYWIVDIAKNRITVYNFNHDYSIEEYSFTDTVKAGIYEDLSIDFSEINIL